MEHSRHPENLAVQRALHARVKILDSSAIFYRSMVTFQYLCTFLGIYMSLNMDNNLVVISRHEILIIYYNLYCCHIGMNESIM